MKGKDNSPYGKKAKLERTAIDELAGDRLTVLYDQASLPDHAGWRGGCGELAVANSPRLTQLTKTRDGHSDYLHRMIIILVADYIG